jgi:Pyruvate/2-oxoacid:ferredoxin oxidoreductase gamma subunit
VATVNATEIAVQNKLGTLGAPIVNTAIVGVVIRILGLTKLESLLKAIGDAITIKPENNRKAASEAYARAGAYV